MSDFKKMQLKRKYAIEDRKRASEEKLKKELKRVGYDFKTTEDIHRELQFEKDEIYRKIPREKKQQFLDLMRAGGITVGEAGKQCGLEFDQYFEIFRRNMETGYFGLKKEPVE